MKKQKSLYGALFDWMGALFLGCLLVLALTGVWTDANADTPVFMHTGAEALVIVVDAGHGGPDGGAESASHIKEAGMNLAVAKLVEKGLQEAGFTVRMTRTGDEALAGDKKQDMKARREIMRGDDVKAVVSIHMNKWKDSAVHGPMAFYMKGSGEGEKLATAVINGVCGATGQAQRPANPGDYYVLRESIAPAVIMECGFLSNPEDLRLLQDTAHQQKLAEGIVAGVASYFTPAGAAGSAAQSPSEGN